MSLSIPDREILKMLYVHCRNFSKSIEKHYVSKNIESTY